MSGAAAIPEPSEGPRRREDIEGLELWKERLARELHTEIQTRLTNVEVNYHARGYRTEAGPREPSSPVLRRDSEEVERWKIEVRREQMTELKNEMSMWGNWLMQKIRAMRLQCHDAPEFCPQLPGHHRRMEQDVPTVHGDKKRTEKPDTSKVHP